MTAERLEELLARIPRLRIAVVGDYFLDKYLVTDPALLERSIETGLEARQVVEVRCSPGAAGTVTNNLSDLGVGQIHAVGVVGDDGEAYELVRGLRASRVATDRLHRWEGGFTPTYTKPMVREPGGERELERLDIKNRRPLPAFLGDETAGALSDLLASRALDAVVIADQVQERDCGVVTDRVRAALAEFASRRPDVVFFADSRVRIGEFRGVLTKPNRAEAAAAAGAANADDADLDQVASWGKQMAVRNGRAVFVTLGEQGMLVCERAGAERVPARRVPGPIDIVGAGDSATAGIVCGLCAGAAPAEAALLGNLCASVTIRKLGTTGTASPDELRAAL